MRGLNWKLLSRSFRRYCFLCLIRLIFLLRLLTVVIVSKKASQHNFKNVGRAILCGSECGSFIHTRSFEGFSVVKF